MGGEKPILIEFLSDQTVNFAESLNKTVNYEDENINISIPVFSIHGNHDDPSGFNNLSALDLISTAGLVNYFGKLTNLRDMEVNPIMLQKGETKITLYGMSYVQDNRLTRLFDDKKVKFSLPEDIDDWFNIFVLHQNRANRGVKNYLPEESLPGFLDLIVWGHEHDCRITPEQNPQKKFYVSQPGSTVATSLAEGEAGVKYCALLQIHQKNFRVEPIPLKCVRPFIFDTLTIEPEEDEELLSNDAIETRVLELAEKKVEEMLKKAEKLRTNHPKQPKLPLLRLRIDVTDVRQMFQTIRFGQSFAGVCANPEDLITFKRQIRRRVADDVKLDQDALEEAYLVENADKVTKVEDVVKRYFDEVEDDTKKLQLLSMDALTELTRNIVNGTSRSDEILDFYMTEAEKWIRDCSETEIDEKMTSFRAADATHFKSLLESLDKVEKPAKMQFDDEDEEKNVPSPTKARGRGRGAASSSNTTTRGRGRGAAKNASNSRMGKLNVSTNTKSHETKNPTIELSDSD